MTQLVVLLVDDDEDTCRIFEMTMNHHHHSLTTVHTPDAAYQAMHTRTFDIVVIDLHLKNASGYELAERLRQQIPGNYKMVATTAYYADATPTRLQENFVGYLKKPLVTASLAAYLEQL